MKKFLVVLLSLGLLVAFGATASAADVTFGGSYYVVGVYNDNANLTASDAGNSRAFFYQRLRLMPVFKIAEGLTLTTRFDVMEKQWGQTNWKSTAAVDGDNTNSRRNPGGTQKAQENIEWERGYVTFKTAIGQFDVGYQIAAAWGTVFADNEDTKPRIKFATQAGPLTLLAIFEKRFEADASLVPGYYGKADADSDNYYLAAVYAFKGGNAGLLYGYIFNNTTRLAATPNRMQLHLLAPYVKATFGPVYVEGEVNYWFGKQVAYDNVAGATDQKRDGWSAYALAKVNMGPAYFGGQVGWSAGWDGTGNTMKTGGGGGSDWNPALILMNDELATWSGTSSGTQIGANASNSGKANMLLWNVFGGFNPSPTMNLEMAFTSAAADKVAAHWDKEMGMEVDVKASYKIYDNLTYMVGAGYLWTGDYFKKGVSTASIGNDYILMNRLTLSF